MSKLRKIIDEKGIKKQYIIMKTGIHRNVFYMGLKHPEVFKPEQIKKIARVLGVKVEAINN